MATIFQKLSGGDQVKKAAKSGKKAAKKQQATSKEQLQYAKDQNTAVQGKLDTSLANQTAALNKSGASQQNALKQAQAQGMASLSGNNAQQHALFDPYTQYGQGGIGLMNGGFGESPGSADAFMSRFKDSPLYQATFQSAMDQARSAAERAASAGGGLNSSRLLQELQDRGGQIGLNSIQDYYNLINNRIGQGMNAANSASSAYGTNALAGANLASNLGQASSSAYGQNGANLSNAYGQFAGNSLQANNQLMNATNTAYGNQLGAQGAQGSAAAAGHMGLANNASGFWNGAANLAGSAIGASTGHPTGGSSGAPMWQNALSAIPGNYS